MATGSTDGQGVRRSVDQRTQECLSLIKNGNGQANIIILLGRTGAGKSSILEDITGASGHSKDASEDDITTENIQIEMTTIDKKQHFIMDTPGFDMDKEVDTFYKINRGIQEVRSHARSWGILYVTKIDSRIETIDEKLLEFVRCFSGQGFIPNITFVTTHWNWQHESENKAKTKWLEKREGLWRNYLEDGARTYHHGRTVRLSNGVESESFLCWYNDRDAIAQRAKGMISSHYGNMVPRSPLFVQELGDGLATYLTTAGFFLDPPPPPTDSDTSSHWNSRHFDEDSGPDWDEVFAELGDSFRDSSYYEDAQEGRSTDTGSSRRPHQPAADAPTPRPGFFERLFASGLGERVEVTPDGPTVGIRDGKLRINGVELAKVAWQALFCSPPAQKQDPSIVNFLNSRGIPSDLGSRKTMAAKYGLDPSLIGTAAGNTLFLNLLKSAGI